MNKKKFHVTFAFVIILSLSFYSGCIDFYQNAAIYKSHPIKINYHINYGYYINVSGEGKFTVFYECNLPEILKGTLNVEPLNKNSYQIISVANNTLIQWNESNIGTNNLIYGVTANVTAESFLVNSLEGNEALSLMEIKINHYEIYDKYCKKQSHENITFINPENSNIKSIALKVLNDANSNNSFTVAKNLFIWLKENTIYQIHQENNIVQSAEDTFTKGSGDCDDLSFLYISLCRSVGIPARFISGFLIEENNDIISSVGHAWVEIYVGPEITSNGWIPVECSCSADIKTELNQNFGVENVYHLRLFEDDGSDESLKTYMSGPKVEYEKNLEISMKSFIEVTGYSVIKSSELIVDGSGNRSYK
ncbi:MAG: transglutaminase domain-containing protein [Candidatus Thermoplasmatota archaeon]|nr:transglutaminase domain-containing protein [Candidatus Thermoplasmatota archaeon]